MESRFVGIRWMTILSRKPAEVFARGVEFAWQRWNRTKPVVSCIARREYTVRRMMTLALLAVMGWR